MHQHWSNPFNKPNPFAVHRNPMSSSYSSLSYRNTVDLIPNKKIDNRIEELKMNNPFNNQTHTSFLKFKIEHANPVSYISTTSSASNSIHYPYYEKQAEVQDYDRNKLDNIKLGNPFHRKYLLKNDTSSELDIKQYFNSLTPVSRASTISLQDELARFGQPRFEEQRKQHEYPPPRNVYQSNYSRPSHTDNEQNQLLVLLKQSQAQREVQRLSNKQIQRTERTQKMVPTRPDVIRVRGKEYYHIQLKNMKALC